MRNKETQIKYHICSSAGCIKAFYYKIRKNIEVKTIADEVEKILYDNAMVIMMDKKQRRRISEKIVRYIKKSQ